MPDGGGSGVDLSTIAEKASATVKNIKEELLSQRYIAQPGPPNYLTYLVVFWNTSFEIFILLARISPDEDKDHEYYDSSKNDILDEIKKYFSRFFSSNLDEDFDSNSFLIPNEVSSELKITIDVTCSDVQFCDDPPDSQIDYISAVVHGEEEEHTFTIYYNQNAVGKLPGDFYGGKQESVTLQFHENLSLRATNFRNTDDTCYLFRIQGDNHSGSYTDVFSTLSCEETHVECSSCKSVCDEEERCEKCHEPVCVDCTDWKWKYASCETCSFMIELIDDIVDNLTDNVSIQELEELCGANNGEPVEDVSQEDLDAFYVWVYS